MGANLTILVVIFSFQLILIILPLLVVAWCLWVVKMGDLIVKEFGCNLSEFVVRKSL